MQNRTSTRSIVEAGLLTAINVVLILASIYVPFLYFVGIFLWPIPIALTFLRHNFKYSLLSVIATGAIVAFTVDPITAVSFAIIYGALGLVMGYCIKKQKSVITTFTFMSIVVFISTAVLIKLSNLILGQDILKSMIQMLDESVKITKEIYGGLGVPQEQIDSLLKKLIPSPDIIIMVFPVTMLLYSLMSALVSYLFAYKIFNRFGYKVEKIKPLSQWYIPVKLATAILVIVLVSFILVVTKFPNALSYYYNAQILFSFVFTINGIAAVDFYFIKREMKGFLRFLIIFFIMTSPLSNIIFIIGIMDYIFNYRKLDYKRIRK
ncbi:YybS family protein [Caloramator sp. ALD01]|uniref:YybS family protein n=1 Tax=Caloramator sp. ALD01 TaxID=1031288 RepID=UPI00040ADE1B|nr:YybS family protein [Caloramator sp. ALD01]